MLNKYKGLRLSLVGAVIAAVSLVVLAALSFDAAAVGLLGGGLLVWSGLVWTISGPEARGGGPPVLHGR